MADATRSQLEQAYRLIQQDKLDQAIALLRPITSAQPNNADAWWLLANAVSEPDDAHNALNHVLQLNPGHTQARDLLNQLETEFPQVATGGSSSGSDFGEVAAFDDLFATKPRAAGDESAGSTSFSDSDIENLFADSSPEPSSFASDFSSSTESAAPVPSEPSFGSSHDTDWFASTPADESTTPSPAFDEDPFGTAEPTFVQAEPFEEPAAQPASKSGRKREKQIKEPKAAKVPKPQAPVDPLALERRVNSRPNTFRVVALLLMLVIIVGAAALFGFTTGLISLPKPQPTNTAIAEPDVAAAAQSVNTLFGKGDFKGVTVALVPSGEGRELQVQYCGEAGPDLRVTIDQSMDLVAQSAALARNNLKAGGVQIVSCAQPDVVLFRVLAPIKAIATYVDGGLKDTRTFRAAWERNSR